MNEEVVIFFFFLFFAIFGVILPIVLTGMWVYEDAKKLGMNQEEISAKGWSLLTILTQGTSIIAYFILRKKYSHIYYCNQCGYRSPVGTSTNFCTRCGEPIDKDIVTLQKSNYKKLLVAGFSMLMSFIIMIVGMFYFIGTSDSTMRGVAIGEKRNESNREEYRESTSKSISAGKDIITYQTHHSPKTLTYDVSTSAGKIKLLLYDDEKKELSDVESNDRGKILLSKKNKDKIIVQVDKTKQGYYRVDWSKERA